jgi:hypothetical protein
MCSTSGKSNTAAGLALLALALAAAGSCASDGAGAERGPAVERAAGTAAGPGASSDESDERGDEPMALVVARAPTLDAAVAAVRARGGRVLVVFDEGAAIIRLAATDLDELAREQSALVITSEPVTDDRVRALAPHAVAFWNRRLGADEPGPVSPAAARATPPPRETRARPPAIGPSVSLDPAANEAARGVIRSLLSCMIEPDRVTRARCFEPLFEPQALEEHRELLEREAAVAAAHGFDPSMITVSLVAYDGRRATYELGRDGSLLPTGTVDMTLGSGRWTIAYIDQ